MITLTLTDDQAEIVGFALMKQAQHERKTGTSTHANEHVRQGCAQRCARLEEVRDILDIAPSA